jgi:peroxiredoxin family protein
MSDEPGVRLIACPLWSELLGLGERLEYLERIDESKLVDLLQNADTVVGGY